MGDVLHRFYPKVKAGDTEVRLEMVNKCKNATNIAFITTNRANFNVVPWSGLNYARNTPDYDKDTDRERQYVSLDQVSFTISKIFPPFCGLDRRSDACFLTSKDLILLDKGVPKICTSMARGDVQ